MKRQTLFRNSLPARLLLVLATFLLMIISSNAFVNNILKRYLKRDAEYALAQTQIRIVSELREPKTLMIGITKEVRGIITRGGTVDDVVNFFNTTSAELRKKTDGFIFGSLHGYFEVFGGEYISKPDWVMPENYKAMEQPWYKAAIKAKGEITVTPIFLNLSSREYQIAFVRQILDDDGNHLGVVSMNTPLHNISEFVAETRLTKGGYGFLANEEFEVVVHPNADFIAKHISEADVKLSDVLRIVETEHGVSGIEVKNYLGLKSIFHCRKIENGWYLGLVIPEDEYYKDWHNMLIIISSLGAILATALIAMLLGLERAKRRSDDTFHLQSLQLALLEKTREAETRTQLMLDTTPLSMNFWDRDFRNIMTNEESVKLFQVSNKQEYLDKFYELSPEFQPDGERSIDKNRKLIQQAFDEGYCRAEWTHQTLRGELIPCEITLVRVKHKNDYIVAGYSRDLRELKAALHELEEALESAELANRAKSSFLANMSHEIRTPMNSIMGFAELALVRASESHIKDYLNRITDSTKWLLHIINDILDISKIESGKMETERVPFNLRDIVSRCQSVILPSTKEKGLDLRTYAELPSGKKLVGDPVRLYQALINILSNAVKFTDAGVVKFSLAVRETTEDSTRIYFEVKDDGIGMSQEQIKKIFDPFIQANTNTTRNYGGTGLGLAITKSLIELMGGELSVESTPGKGSTFSFEITFNTIDSDEHAHSHAKLETLEKPLFNGLILICDDNPMNRQVICEHLDNVGIGTVVAENGKIGVDKVVERMQNGEKNFDMIFMDMFMPIMDGMEAAAEITKLNTGTPIVAMTANVMVGELEKYRMNGMPDCLGKPFTTQELWRILLKYITPISSAVVDKREHERSKRDLNERLRINFVRNNQNAYKEIADAIANNDITLAHRLAHTLKGNAGQLGKKELQNAATVVEKQLKSGKMVSESDMNLLKSEFMLVMADLENTIDNQEEPISLNAEQTRELFEKLEQLIENINPACADLLDDIRAVPDSEELARQIENFDFEAAAKTLAELKKREVTNNG